MSVKSETSVSSNLKRKITEKSKCNKKIVKLLPIRLDRHFFNMPCLELAKALLGKVLVRKLNDSLVLKGLIVETECYLGGEDKASHSYGGRCTARNEPMYMAAGTSYVYNIYGIYSCFNISSCEPGAAVLIRALEPLAELETMKKKRNAKIPSKKITIAKDKDLCNGPSKLCISMEIDKATCNKEDLSSSNLIWIEDNIIENLCVIKSTRIGIQSAGEEWVKKLLRFYILNNPCVSKKDKFSEKAYNM